MLAGPRDDGGEVLLRYAASGEKAGMQTAMYSAPSSVGVL
jgi:hypothetical protein